MEEESVNCRICGKKMKNFTTERKHLRSIHKMFTDVRKSYQCIEPQCTEAFSRIEKYREHLYNEHNVKNIFERQCLLFYDTEHFEQWIANEQIRTKTSFLRSKKLSIGKNSLFTSVQYDCSRSGKFKSKSTGMRQLKVQGSIKMGFRCTANIKAKIFKDKVEVIYYKCHYKHESFLEHLYMTKKKLSHFTNEPKIELASKLTTEIKRHIDGELLVSSCTEIDENLWEITSPISEETFSIYRNPDHTCNPRCTIPCKDCQCCRNVYHCTCNESKLKKIMCRHIHACVVYKNKKDTSAQPVQSATAYLHGIIHEAKQSCQQNSLVDSNNFLQTKFSSVVRIFNQRGGAVTQEVSQLILTHLNSIEDLLMSQPVLEVSSEEPPKPVITVLNQKKQVRSILPSTNRKVTSTKPLTVLANIFPKQTMSEPKSPIIIISKPVAN